MRKDRESVIDFEAGSDKCHALRRAFGFEPFLSLEGMSEAIEKLEAKPEKSEPKETIRDVKFIEAGGKFADFGGDERRLGENTSHF